MRLQRIALETQEIPEPNQGLKQKFVECETIKVVKSAEDIERLNNLLAFGLDEFVSNASEKVNLSTISAKVRLAKTYYDPTSVFDNFI